MQSMGNYRYFIVSQVVLLVDSDHCVLKKLIPCPHEYIYIYIYIKSYELDSISCTGFVRGIGYKSLLLVDHVVTSLLVCRHGGGGGVTMIIVIMGPIPMRGGRGRRVWR